MPTQSIPVTWDSGNSRPTAPNVTVQKNDGATTIEWTAGSGITNITISGLDATEFTGWSGQGTNLVSVTDNNNDATNKDYGYTIQATHSGVTGRHDPKITNGGRGGVFPSARRSPSVDPQP